ncbi:MAG: arylesterase [Kiritimatiellia bacterium]|nr:arylesterase [Kiritimatiellia bacterium]
MRKRNGWIGAVGVVWLLAGCGRGPQLAPLSADSVVLCFGDSLTAGTGAEPAESYPAVLAERLGCRVVNAGVPGEVTAEGLERLPGLLRRHEPDLVILCHGGNDMLRQEHDAALAARVRAMIEASQASGAEVLLLGVPRPGLFLRAPRFYEEVAQACGVPYDRKTLPALLGRRSLKSDLLHPNAAGYRLLAERVAAQLRARAR